MLKPSVEVRKEGDVLVAEFWDCLRLDPAPVQELRRQFESHLKANGQPLLVVDLNGVGFAGSAALGGFVAIHRLAKQHSGRLIFCNVDPTVQEVLRVSKLENLFAIVSDKAAALALAHQQGDAPPPDDPSAGQVKDPRGQGNGEPRAQAPNDHPPLRRRNRKD